ncbi:MAG: potassium-transporting ATPase subunit C [Microbacterium sp. 69-10]|uniref:potassium-transporting ATPase subunit KdpC n=1 Tax=Microbacterium sp. 69-10 TaxID=1895783 RepID=UPI00095B518C|nr:potassium-transporting ATPase subunit KdpC [Microbacterium sp. 69-10]OJU41082.1 MAG: potassium-transporting ATPase subunit C [Microbacterium sp. 69-10]
MSNLRTTGRTALVAVRAVLVFTVLLGILYPLAVTGIGQLAFPAQANGSMLTADGKAVGSSLIGQAFTAEDGTPLPQYFQSRPSASGQDGYDAMASGGSNLGPSNSDLLAQIRQRRAAIAAFEGVDPSLIPPDALTASASGLDPQISPEYALLQVRRVADARGLSDAAVRALVESRIQGRDLGFLGEPRVNVLELNLALDRLSSGEEG